METTKGNSPSLGHGYGELSMSAVKIGGEGRTGTGRKGVLKGGKHRIQIRRIKENYEENAHSGRNRAKYNKGKIGAGALWTGTKNRAHAGVLVSEITQKRKLNHKNTWRKKEKISEGGRLKNFSLKTTKYEASFADIPEISETSKNQRATTMEPTTTYANNECFIKLSTTTDQTISVTKTTATTTTYVTNRDETIRGEHNNSASKKVNITTPAKL